MRKATSSTAFAVSSSTVAGVLADRSPCAGHSVAGFSAAELAQRLGVGFRPASVQWSQSVVYGAHSLPGDARASPQKTIGGPCPSNGEGEMIARVARRRDDRNRPAVPVDRLAVVQRAIDAVDADRQHEVRRPRIAQRQRLLPVLRHARWRQPFRRRFRCTHGDLLVEVPANRGDRIAMVMREQHAVDRRHALQLERIAIDGAVDQHGMAVVDERVAIGLLAGAKDAGSDFLPRASGRFVRLGVGEISDNAEGDETAGGEE